MTAPRPSAARRRPLAVVAAGLALAVALGLGAAWTLLGGLRAPLRLEAGRAYDYRLSYRGEEGVALAAALGATGTGREAPLRARYAFDGTLRLAALEARQGGVLVAASFPEVRHLSLELLGQPALPPGGAARAQLVGPEAALLLGPDGGVRELRFPPGAPALFRQLLLAVLSQGRLELRAGAARWEAVEAGQRGELEVAWRARRGLGEDVAVKALRRYRSLHAVPRPLDGLRQELRGRLTATLSPGGELRRLVATERLALRGPDGAALVEASADLSLELRRAGPLPSTEPPAAQAARLLAAVAEEAPARLDLPAAAAPAAALARVAAGNDLAALLGRLGGLGPGVELPRDFMWRGAAWLRLHPEDCAALLARLGELPPRGRRAAVTLLVATGTPAAQAALRALLGDEARRRDPDRPRWLATLSFLAGPEPETLRLLADTAAAAGPGRDEATLALGAAIRGARGEAAALAAELNGRLQLELRTSGDPARRQALLTAMANAGRPENVAEIAPLAGDPAPTVRAAAANALRQTQTPEAERLLLALATDPDRPVQAVALQTLAGYRLDGERLDRLSALVAAGAIGELGFPDLLQLAARARLAGAPAEALRGLLAAMAARPIRRQELRDLVERALAQAR